MSDDRIEAFMKQVLHLEGAPHVGEVVRILLADYGEQFPDIERAAYPQRVKEEMKRRKGTQTEHHLRVVLATIDLGSSFPLRDK
jgi:hypothetical protein